MTTVWIDSDNCLGAGTCAQIAPDVFHRRGDGLWAVKESARFFDEETIFDGATRPGHGPEGAEGRARVPQQLLELVEEAVEECPAECIHMVEDQ